MRFALLYGFAGLLLACTPPSLLPSEATDAARWFDVGLPDVPGGDGFVLTLVALDGGVTAEETADAGCASPAVAVLDATLPVDAAGSEDAADDAPIGDACPGTLGVGDLVFNEAMISSEPGSSDRGQWLEIMSTRACSVDLVGLHASAPHGASARTVDVTGDLWLPAGGFFLIADTLDPSENNALPGRVLAWADSPADALHKTSDTITLSLGMTTLATLSYPDKKRAEGTSMAFPLGCAPGLRSDFTSWLPSTASWTMGLFGTPNAPNTDVHCAATKSVVCGR